MADNKLDNIGQIYCTHQVDVTLRDNDDKTALDLASDEEDEEDGEEDEEGEIDDVVEALENRDDLLGIGHTC